MQDSTELFLTQEVIKYQKEPSELVPKTQITGTTLADLQLTDFNSEVEQSALFLAPPSFPPERSTGPSWVTEMLTRYKYYECYLLLADQLVSNSKTSGWLTFYGHFIHVQLLKDIRETGCMYSRDWVDLRVTIVVIYWKWVLRLLLVNLLQEVSLIIF